MKRLALALAATALIAGPASALEYPPPLPGEDVTFMTPEAQNEVLDRLGLHDVVRDYGFYHERCAESPNLQDCLLEAYSGEILRRRNVCGTAGTPEGIRVEGWHICEERSYPMGKLEDFTWHE